MPQAALQRKSRLEDMTMYPDREYRFVLATLDPMPSLNEAGWYIAIQHAMNDAEAAGLDAANDPGVRLLRLKSTTTQSASVENPEMTELQNICQRRLAELRREPTLALIGSYDIASDDKLKQWFHAEARKALVAMADKAAIDPRMYQLRHRLGHRYEPGSTYIVGKGFHIEVTAGRKFGANVGLYKTKDRDYLTGDTPRWRSLLQLLDTADYALWLKDQLRLMQIMSNICSPEEALDPESGLTHSDERIGQ